MSDTLEHGCDEHKDEVMPAEDGRSLKVAITTNCSAMLTPTAGKQRSAATSSQFSITRPRRPVDHECAAPDRGEHDEPGERRGIARLPPLRHGRIAASRAARYSCPYHW